MHHRNIVNIIKYFSFSLLDWKYLWSDWCEVSLICLMNLKKSSLYVAYLKYFLTQFKKCESKCFFLLANMSRIYKVLVLFSVWINFSQAHWMIISEAHLSVAYIYIVIYQFNKTLLWCNIFTINSIWIRKF